MVFSFNDISLQFTLSISPDSMSEVKLSISIQLEENSLHFFRAYWNEEGH